MKNITLIHVGDFRETLFSDAEKEYIKRISPFYNYRTVFIKEESTHGENSEKLIEKALSKEADAIISAIPKNCVKIAMCIEGKEYDSVSFADFLNKTDRDICFIIGSSFGLDEKFKSVCDYRFSMSKMTFPHRLARVMLAEQVYRAACINTGKKYHK